jgi:hypothetical protein
VVDKEREGCAGLKDIRHGGNNGSRLVSDRMKDFSVVRAQLLQAMVVEVLRNGSPHLRLQKLDARIVSD